MYYVRSCNDEARLRDHLEGRLRHEEEVEVIAHLDECQNCRETLDRLADATTIIETARRSGTAAVDADGTFIRLIEDLKNSFGDVVRDRKTAGEINKIDELLQHGRLHHYRLMSIAGQGGAGVVIKAFDEKLNRLVCLKLFTDVAMATSTARERVLREARAAAAVHDEHVVQIYAVEDCESWVYLALEFVPGLSLQAEIDRRGQLPIDEVVRIGSQIAAGLAAAHSRGLVHRDVKPSNILLETDTTRVKLADFGMARTPDDSRLTAEGCIAGTPEYMAPEQVLGGIVDHRADLFSLGSVLMAMSTGHSPFAGGGTLSVLRRIVDDVPPPIEQSRPDIPDRLARLIRELHAKAPADRPQSASAVQARLAECMAEPPAKPLLLRRSVLLTAASLAAACATGGVWSTLPRRGWRKSIRSDEADTATLMQSFPKDFRRVLFVIAPQDYYELYYTSVRRQLEQNHVKCETASTTMEDCMPNDNGSLFRVHPDLLINNVRGTNYNVVYFCGGSSVYGDGGSHANQAKQLIDDALRGSRTVAAMGRGPVVLAEAGVLRGRPATCSRWGKPPGEFVARLEAAGVQWQDVPVVEDGPFLTGRDPEDVNHFVRALLKRLEVPTKVSPRANSDG